MHLFYKPSFVLCSEFSFPVIKKRGKPINSKRKVRLLDVGWGLTKPQGLESVKVEEKDFASGDSFYDYDSVFLDPGKISSLWTDHLRPRGDGSFKSNPREDGGLTRGLQNLMRARREEVKALLSKNGSVFCKLRKPSKELAVVKNDENESIGIYSWLPTSEDLFAAGAERIKNRSGERLEIKRKETQLGNFLDSYSELISYSAVLSDDIQLDNSGLEPLAVTPSGDIASFVLNTNEGNIYFLPAEMKLGQTALDEFIEAATNRFGFQFHGGPSWLDEYSLNEEEVLRSEVEKIEAEMAELSRKKEEKREELNTVSSFKRLLAAKSGFELKSVLRRVLDGLGFGTENANSGIDLLVSSPEGESFALKVGVSCDGPLGLEPYHELVRGINDLKIYENDDPQGVLVVNGYSGSDPAERPDQVKDELLNGCNLYGFTVVTSAELFDAIKGAESEAEKAAAVEKLFQQV